MLYIGGNLRVHGQKCTELYLLSKHAKPYLSFTFLTVYRSIENRTFPKAIGLLGTARRTKSRPRFIIDAN